MTTPTASEGAGNPDTLLMGVWDGTATRTQFGRFFENLSVQPPFNPATALIPEKWKLQEALGQMGSGRGERMGVSVFNYTEVNRAVTSRCDFARRYPWGKPSQGYTGSVCVLSDNRV